MLNCIFRQGGGGRSKDDLATLDPAMRSGAGRVAIGDGDVQMTLTPGLIIPGGGVRNDQLLPARPCPPPGHVTLYVHLLSFQ